MLAVDDDDYDDDDPLAASDLHAWSRDGQRGVQDAE